MAFTVTLYIIVNILLIKGTAGLFRVSVGLIALIISAIVSGAYVLICICSNNPVICSVPVYLLTVMIIGFISFGVKYRSLPCMFSFVLLYVSLGGFCIGRQAIFSLMTGAVGILIVVFLTAIHHDRTYVTVKFRYDLRDFKIWALLDTGNLLKDPITGCPVLIVAANIAQEMTGLTIEQLKSPVESIGSLPGSRLIPYKTVGQSGAFLLGLYITHLQVGSWQGRGVIALSPEFFGSNKTYQALTGGYV